MHPAIGYISYQKKDFLLRLLRSIYPLIDTHEDSLKMIFLSVSEDRRYRVYRIHQYICSGYFLTRIYLPTDGSLIIYAFDTFHYPHHLAYHKSKTWPCWRRDLYLRRSIIYLYGRFGSEWLASYDLTVYDHRMTSHSSRDMFSGPPMASKKGKIEIDW